jgi:hypothetical protein
MLAPVGEWPSSGRFFLSMSVDSGKRCMDEIQTLTQALEALKGEASKVGALERDLVAANALLDEQAAGIKASSQLIQTLQQQIADLQAQVASSVVTEIKVNEALAAVGVAPVDIPMQGSESHQRSADELWAEYRSLDLYSRNAFFQTHRDKLSTLKK